MGVVLSIAWLFVALAYSAFDYCRVNSKESGWETSGGSGTLPFETIPASLFTERKGYGGKGILTTCSPRYVNVALLAFGPIALGWLLVLCVVYAVLWIRAGFRDKEYRR